MHACMHVYIHIEHMYIHTDCIPLHIASGRWIHRDTYKKCVCVYICVRVRLHADATTCVRFDWIPLAHLSSLKSFFWTGLPDLAWMCTLRGKERFLNAILSTSEHTAAIMDLNEQQGCTGRRCPAGIFARVCERVLKYCEALQALGIAPHNGKTSVLNCTGLKSA